MDEPRLFPRELVDDASDDGVRTFFVVFQVPPLQHKSCGEPCIGSKDNVRSDVVPFYNYFLNYVLLRSRYFHTSWKKEK